MYMIEFKDGLKDFEMVKSFIFHLVIKTCILFASKSKEN